MLISRALCVTASVEWVNVEHIANCKCDGVIWYTYDSQHQVDRIVLY